MEDTRKQTREAITLIKKIDQLPNQHFFKAVMSGIVFPNKNQQEFIDIKINNLTFQYLTTKKEFLIIKDTTERSVSKREMDKIMALIDYYTLEKNYLERIEQICNEQRKNYKLILKLSLEKDLQELSVNGTPEEKQLKTIEELLQAIEQAILHDAMGNYEISMIKFELLQKRVQIETNYNENVQGKWMNFSDSEQMPGYSHISELKALIEMNASKEFIQRKLKVLLDYQIFSIGDYNTLRNLLIKNKNNFIKEFAKILNKKKLAYQINEIRKERNIKKQQVEFYKKLYEDRTLLEKIRQIYYETKQTIHMENLITDYRNTIEINSEIAENKKIV